MTLPSQTRSTQQCAWSAPWLWTAAIVTLLMHGQPAFAEQGPQALIGKMAGTWTVQQRMWMGPALSPQSLPPALARRRLMEGGYLEELMTPAEKSANESFLRTAYFNYNAVSRRYEYFSIDSRAPQMMNERSQPTGANAIADADGIKLQGEVFTAPHWGEARNMSFAYRLTVGPVEDKRQTVRVYLTPQVGDKRDEFLFFEYVYTQR